MKTKKSDPFYSSRTWRKVRMTKLSSSPLCEMCSKNGIVRTATLVDHIHERKDGGEDYDQDNLQSLCRSCHEQKTKMKKKERAAGVQNAPTCPTETPWN